MSAQKTYSPPADFELDTELRAWAEPLLPPETLEDELSKFRAWRFSADRHNWSFAARKWLQRAIDRHKAITVSSDLDAAREQRTDGYARPASASNPYGNPHRILLPEGIAQRKPGEPLPAYEQRIAGAVTHALYARRS